MRVRALTRGAKPLESELLTWIPGSLESPTALEALVDGATHLVHLAARVRGNTRDDFLATNTHATNALLDCCAKSKSARRILLVSSLAARKPNLSHYAESKHLAERGLAQHSRGLEWTIFRPPAVYGPGDKEIRPLLKLASLGVLPVPGNADHRVSLLHVEDLVAAMLAWLPARQAHGELFELCDSTIGGYDWKQLAHILSEHQGRKVRLLRLPHALLVSVGAVSLGVGRLIGRPVMLSPGKARELLHADWTADATLAIERLEWQPRLSFAQGLATLSPALGS